MASFSNYYLLQKQILQSKINKKFRPITAKDRFNMSKHFEVDIVLEKNF